MIILSLYARFFYSASKGGREFLSIIFLFRIIFIVIS